MYGNFKKNKKGKIENDKTKCFKRFENESSLRFLVSERGEWWFYNDFFFLYQNLLPKRMLRSSQSQSVSGSELILWRGRFSIFSTLFVERLKKKNYRKNARFRPNRLSLFRNYNGYGNSKYLPNIVNLMLYIKGEGGGDV